MPYSPAQDAAPGPATCVLVLSYAPSPLASTSICTLVADVAVSRAALPSAACTRRLPDDGKVPIVPWNGTGFEIVIDPLTALLDSVPETLY